MSAIQPGRHAQQAAQLRSIRCNQPTACHDRLGFHRFQVAVQRLPLTVDLDVVGHQIVQWIFVVDAVTVVLALAAQRDGGLQHGLLIRRRHLDEFLDRHVLE